MVNSKLWADDNFDIKIPLGGGGRYIIIHAGSRRGFVDDGLKCFHTTQIDGDYHKSMDSKVFEDWFQTQLVPNLLPNSLIVMDNAPYHSRIINKCPTSSNNKADIIQYLIDHSIVPNPTILKPESLLIANEIAPPKVYFIDEIAKKFGHRILRLPPYHCELSK